MLSTIRSGRVRYRYGFFARYLRQYVLAKIDAEGWRQYDVAAWLGLPAHALSEYLNRHTHPEPPRRKLLERLGCHAEALLRAEQADKLEWWMRSQKMDVEDVRTCLRQIEAYENHLEVARQATRKHARVGVTRTGTA